MDGTIEAIWQEKDNRRYVYLLQRGDYVVQKYLSEADYLGGGYIDNVAAWAELEQMISDDYVAAGLSPYGTVMGL